MLILEVTAHIDAQCEPIVHLRDLGTSSPWASVRIGSLTFLCGVGTAAVFQQAADRLRELDIITAPGIEKTDNVEANV
jgi:hypothetical protein